MSRRTICETDYAGEARLLAAGYASLGVEAATHCHAAIASTWRKADGSLYFRNWREYAPGFES